MLPDKSAGIDWRLLLPLVTCGVLVMVVVPLARVSTTYSVLGLDVSSSSLGMLSAAFALLPIVFALFIGRYNDRNGEAHALVAGAVLIAVAIIGLGASAASVWMLMLFTVILGSGHVLLIAALQMLTTKCSGPAHHDTVLGHFLLATGLGQAIGPLFITVATPTGSLTPGPALGWILLSCSLLVVVTASWTAWRLPRHLAPAKDTRMPVRRLLRLPGLSILIVASSILVTSNDLVLVFFPALGAERGIEAGIVGLLLSCRAVASMSARALFAGLARQLGKPRLLTIAMSITAFAFVGLLWDMPVAILGALLCLAGFASSLAIAASISLALSLAPDGMRATTVSLRITANRLGQFVIPMAAGGTTVIFGAAGVFVLIGMAMLAAALSSLRLKP